MNPQRFPSLQIASGALLLLAALVFGRSGPNPSSYRALAMGNAAVAIVDDKDALYYNPAGLAQINALGNASSRPDLAAYPRDRMDLRLDVGISGPLSDGFDIWDVYTTHRQTFKHPDDNLSGDDSLEADIVPFDKKPLNIGLTAGTVFAMHDFGVALWENSKLVSYVDGGILAPQFGIQTVQVDAVFQIAGAHGFMDDKLSIGVGYRLANREELKNIIISGGDLIDQDKLDQTIEDYKDSLRAKNNYSDLGSYGHGLDLGALWQQDPTLRFGAALQNLGMVLDGELVTPKFTVGTAYTPSMLQSGGKMSRKINLALDLEDLLNHERNYKFLSKVNFGAEVEQNLWWIASLRLSGGFKGGYWTAGAGLGLLKSLHIEAVSWSEETGYYTGQSEDRHFAVNIALGV